MALAAEVKSQEGKVRRTEGDGRRDPIADLWGANYYPGLGASQCIEFTALINIRPAQGNRSMEIQDAGTRNAVGEIVHALVGAGEPL
ncbi:MAG: hypothetical protein A3G76_04015 [Acidobacteria bacterium RIFCSPLOWO2_12_FULL_65_11]|nr:MAG: hypothetical protein A3H95_16620 [Acidobacteria bacterium RIFCSPLOWO2_02_FULL_64_15]OFW34660.1 MAG: hypothetical protein A3G76_04015 [Acidobacteria bacterium RIFCSPLOWO2_12_FULL_65_11]